MEVNRRKAMISKVDHIGIVVESLDECLKKYDKLFHVKAKHIQTMHDLGLRIAFVPVGEVMVELLEPLAPGKGRIGEFLEKHGEGLHHIAYRVDNLERSLVEMKQTGVRLIDDTPRIGAEGFRIAFISPEETNNVLTELVERSN